MGRVRVDVEHDSGRLRPSAAERRLGRPPVSEVQRRLTDAVSGTGDLMRAIVEAAQEGVWVTDQHGRTVLANGRMATFLGVSREALAAGSIGDFFDPAARAEINRRLLRRQAGVEEQYELTFLRPDGSRRWLRISGLPRFDPLGRYLGAVAMCTDITGELELHHQIETALVRVGLAMPAERPHAARPLPSPDLDVLSEREVEIVGLLLRGDRVPQIAASLYISKSTVRNHLSSVFRKLQVSSQQELIVLLRDGVGPNSTPPAD